MNTNSRIFVAGGRTGFTGANMAKALLERNATVYIHSQDGSKASFFKNSTPNCIEMTSDLSTSVMISSEIGYVSHLTAQSYPRTSFSAPFDTLETNTLGTAQFLEALRRSSTNPLIHVCSSSDVYSWVSREKLPINEDCSLNPILGESYNIGETYSCTVGKMLDSLVSRSTHQDHIKGQQDTERLRPLYADLQVSDTLKFKA